MSTKARLKRKSFFVDELALRRVRRALRAKSDAEVIRLSIERVAEMEAFWQFMRRDFQNDALIALTARRHGAIVVTANRADFELLSGEVGVSVLPV